MARRLDTALFRETRNASGSGTRVRELIAAGADVNRRHKYGNTPLWEAASHGRVDVVSALLEARADPGVCADDRSGPLHWAANNGHLSVVEMLLAAGASPNALRDTGQSPLAAAISKGHAEIVTALLAAGASTDHPYFGRTIVGYAERYGRPEIVAILRRAGGATDAGLEHFQDVFGPSADGARAAEPAGELSVHLPGVRGPVGHRPHAPPGAAPKRFGRAGRPHSQEPCGSFFGNRQPVQLEVRLLRVRTRVVLLL